MDECERRCDARKKLQDVAGVADAAVAGAAVAGAADWARYGFDQAYPFSMVPAFPGEAPCISPAGLPYHTPVAAPCYP
jgi:hypothetical protein